MSQSAHLLLWQSSDNMGLCFYICGTAACCFPVVAQEIQKWIQTVVSRQDSYLVIAPLFYRYFISYEKEPLQTALLSLPVLFLRVLSLIKACPSFDMAITRTVAVCQTSSRMHSIFDKKQRSGGNISLSKWPHCCETGSDFSFLFFSFFFGNVRPLVLLKKMDAGDSLQSKTFKRPLFCDSAESSIWVSFRDMELIRKGQRAAQLQGRRREFSFCAAWLVFWRGE